MSWTAACLMWNVDQCVVGGELGETMGYSGFGVACQAGRSGRADHDRGRLAPRRGRQSGRPDCRHPLLRGKPQLENRRRSVRSGKRHDPARSQQCRVVSSAGRALGQGRLRAPPARGSHAAEVARSLQGKMVQVRFDIRTRRWADPPPGTLKIDRAPTYDVALWSCCGPARRSAGRLAFRRRHDRARWRRKAVPLDGLSEGSSLHRHRAHRAQSRAAPAACTCFWPRAMPANSAAMNP